MAFSLCLSPHSERMTIMPPFSSKELSRLLSGQQSTRQQKVGCVAVPFYPVLSCNAYLSAGCAVFLLSTVFLVFSPCAYYPPTLFQEPEPSKTGLQPTRIALHEKQVGVLVPYV